MPRPASHVWKKGRHECAICDPIERCYGWLVTAMREILRGGGPPSPAEVRAYRRQFKREVPTRPGDPHRATRLWQLEVERRPELRVPGHRPTVPISGVILYVLAAVVAQLLVHDEELQPGERKAHFTHDTAVVGEIVRLGREALAARGPTRHDLGREGLEGRVLARLLGLEEKLVRIRLRPSDLRAEIDAARAAGHLAWVSPYQLLWAAQYRKDTAILTALRAARERQPQSASVWYRIRCR